MFEQFEEWHVNRHDYARAWKERTGGKVLSYFCTYVPEELLYAANILPVRIFGSHEPEDVTEPHVFGMFCPFSRDCLAQGLKGRYDYAEGLMIAQSCLHIRQSFWSWRTHRPTPFSYYLPMPHNVQSPHATPFLAQELKTFQSALEEWIGHEISEEDVDRGIEVMDTNRRLMRQVYELRRADNPPLTGAEAMSMVISAQVVDKEEHNRLLTQVLEELPHREMERDTGLRLMIIGSEDDDVDFMRMVESLGTTFVTDDHCTGSRYFWNEVEEDTDRLTAIAARYVDRTPCPTKDWPQRRRFDQIRIFAEEYRVQGALLAQQKFCDPHEADMPALRELFKEMNIPTYSIEFDLTTPMGPIKTRVEAFLETLREEELF